MKALVVAASPLLGEAQLRELARSADLVVAADGGAGACLEADVTPHAVVGDFDSLQADALARLQAAEVEVDRVPTRKDETDLELALLEAVRRGASDITVLGAIGGRLDHTLGNILLLTMPELEGRQVRLLHDDTEVRIIRGETKLWGEPGDLVSLIPLTPEVTGIETDGLEYPLRGESLYMGPGRGISNRLLDDDALVSVGEGILLAVIIHGPSEE